MVGIAPERWPLLHTHAANICPDLLTLADPMLWPFFLRAKVGIAILVLAEAMDLIVVKPVQIEKTCHPRLVGAMLQRCLHQQRLHCPGFFPLVPMQPLGKVMAQAVLFIMQDEGALGIEIQR